MSSVFFKDLKKYFQKSVLKKNVKKKQIASRFVKVLKKTLKKNNFGGAVKQKTMDLDCCGAARRRQNFFGIFLCPYAFPPSFSRHLERSGGC